MARDRLRDQAVGAVLRRLREGTGAAGAGAMTQREVAQAIGLTGPGGPVSISRFESGTVHVPPDRLAALAELFGTTATQVDEEASALAEEARASTGDVATHSAAALATKARAALGGGATVQDAYLRRVAIDREVADRRERTEALLERLHDAQQELVDGVLKPYLEQAATLGLPVPTPATAEGQDRGSSQDARLDTTKTLLRRQIGRSVASADTDAGAAAGAGAATAVFAWVAASASAPSSAAVLGVRSGLATSATLAWLGSGPLAAGELGLAGASLLMGSIVMMPALIAAGGVVALHSHRLRHEAAAESERLDLAEAELAATGVQLDTTWQTIIRARTVIDAITTIGLREVRWLGRESAGLTSGPGSGPDRARFDSLSELVVTATVVLGLPILRDLQPDAVDDPEREERAQWIRFVLDHAAAQVEGYPRAASS